MFRESRTELTYEIILVRPPILTEKKQIKRFIQKTLPGRLFLTWKDRKKTCINTLGSAIVTKCILTSVLALLIRCIPARTAQNMFPEP